MGAQEPVQAPSSEALSLITRELGPLGGGSGCGGPRPLASQCLTHAALGRWGLASRIHTPRSPRLPPLAGAADLGTPDHGPAHRRALRSGFWGRASWSRGPDAGPSAVRGHRECPQVARAEAAPRQSPQGGPDAPLLLTTAR